MAYYDREYYREDSGIGGGRSLSRTSAVTWILAINVVIWLFDEILSGSARADTISPIYWLNFNINEAVHRGQAWRWITYQFVHSLTDFLHILFNMMILAMLGPMLETWWGTRKFVAFYLLCGTCGAVVFAVLAFIPGLLPDGNAHLIGASGSIYGILVACAMVYPTQRMRLLFLPFDFKLRTMCMILLGIAVAQIIAGSVNAGSGAAHLGGAVLGFFLVQFPNTLNFMNHISFGRLSPRRIIERRKKVVLQKRAMRDQAFEAQIDHILDKVAREGLHSLTPKEKKMLQQATERQRQA